MVESQYVTNLGVGREIKVLVFGMDHAILVIGVDFFVLVVVLEV